LIDRFIALADTADGQVNMDDVARQLGVSSRCLRQNVRRHCGTSAGALWRHRRFVRVRHALAAANGATVTEIAVAHGFYQLGRFAGQYRDLFGELPSETQRRRRHHVHRE
jgi:transcriptional regulator GlxA family with amidase domain